MKLKVVNINNNVKTEIKLPDQFKEPVRPDLIRRAFLALQSATRQPYGIYKLAGKETVAWTSKRRRDYKSSYGRGISRVPRKVLLRRGSMFYWQGAFAPGTVGGRRAHPPKADKIWEEKINKKEKAKAIRSAIAATIVRELVAKKHKIPETYPFIISDEIEKISKTKELVKILEALGFKEELERCKEKKIRSGKGKMRGRRYRKKRGILIVTSSKAEVEKAAKNVAGLDIVPVKTLNIKLLAPGGEPGRLTLFTESAIQLMAKENLFIK